MWQGALAAVLVLSFQCVSSDTSSDLNAIIKEFWDWRLIESPEFGTKYGLYTHEEDAEQYTFAAFDKRKEKADELSARLGRLADVSLKGQDKISYAVLKSLLEAFLMGYEFRYYGPMNPATSMDTPISDWSNVISWMRKDTKEDFEKIITRLGKAPAMMDQLIVFMQKAIEMKTTQHEKAMTGVQGKFDDLINRQPTETFFYAPFKSMPSNVSASDQADLKQRAEARIKDEVLPAFRKLRDFIVNTYMKNLRPKIAATSLPNGKAYYKACLKWHLSMEMTPEEIHKKGLEDVERIAGKMQEIMKKDKFDGTIKEYVAKLNSNPSNFYQTEQAMLNGFKNIIENKIRSKLGMVLPIDSVPELKLEVRKSPNAGGSTGRYTEPPVDGSRPGIFWANVANPNTRPKYNMMALALHEAEPGHHTQASYNYGNNLPLFRRLIEYRKYYAVPYNWPFFTAYIEGWALYAESLGEEMGVYQGNDYFGRYASEIHRAARLVVDTGLHFYEKPYEWAEEYFTNYTSLSKKQIENELNRYIGWPGQAISYKIGELKIRELRELAEKDLKENFDLREFNNETLFTGPVPMDELDKQIRAWISRKIETSGAPRISLGLFTPIVVALIGLLLRN